MVKIKKFSDKLARFLSRVYVSPKHTASFTGLDKLYRTAKNQFPSVFIFVCVCVCGGGGGK